MYLDTHLCTHTMHSHNLYTHLNTHLHLHTCTHTVDHAHFIWTLRHIRTATNPRYIHLPLPTQPVSVHTHTHTRTHCHPLLSVHKKAGCTVEWGYYGELCYGYRSAYIHTHYTRTLYTHTLHIHTIHTHYTHTLLYPYTHNTTPHSSLTPLHPIYTCVHAHIHKHTHTHAPGIQQLGLQLSLGPFVTQM